MGKAMGGFGNGPPIRPVGFFVGRFTVTSTSTSSFILVAPGTPVVVMQGKQRYCPGRITLPGSLLCVTPKISFIPGTSFFSSGWSSYA